MPRNMSFSITTEQMYRGAKVVTRRLGWDNLKPGDVVCAVEKGMGLKKGEKVKRIGMIEILAVTREPLSRMTYTECAREGFPEMTPDEFIAMFCRANKCAPDTLVNRIAFVRRYEVQPDAQAAAAEPEPAAGTTPAPRQAEMGMDAKQKEQ